MLNWDSSVKKQLVLAMKSRGERLRYALFATVNVEVDGADGCNDDERNLVPGSEHSGVVGTNLVGSVAVLCNSVSTDR